MTNKQQAIAMAGVLILSACGAEVYDAGSNDTEAGPTSAKRTYPPYPPPSESFGCVPGDPACYGNPCEGEVPPDVAGAWVGEFDDYALSSGSRAVRVEFRGNHTFSDPGLCGVVTFGTGAPPPMPSDPDSLEAYPPGTEFTTGLPNKSRYRNPYEGFQYEFYVSKMSFHGPSAVRFGIMMAQIVKAYCDMQTSYRQDEQLPITSYSCIPSHWGESDRSGGSGCQISLTGASGTFGCAPPDCVPVSCEKIVLCELDLACSCDATGCWLHYEPDALVDLMLNGDTATGSIAIDDGIHSLHLTRVR